MSLVIHLLGRPYVESAGGEPYRFRSRKSWALLAYLMLAERPPSRAQLAGLLFAEADDPLGALRWSLAEIRRVVTTGGGSIDGDPVELTLPPLTVVDVDIVIHGSWDAAVAMPGLGAPLLDGAGVRGAAGFESWLLVEQRRVAAAAEAILHEAALATMSRGDFAGAVGHAARAAAMSPYDENHHALLIRLYRLAGDDPAAEAQFATCTKMLRRDLDTAPGPVVREAMRETRHGTIPAMSDATSIEAIVEAGAAAVSAGAIEAGVHSLRNAVRLADAAGAPSLRIRSRLVLAEALVHSVGGLDEDGLANLHEADEIALAAGDTQSVAQARSEIGYVDFLRARYDRAERWLGQALRLAVGSPSMVAKAQTYLGSVASDRGDYRRAIELLADAQRHAEQAGDLRRSAFVLSMLGRVSLLRGDLATADEHLLASIELAERDHWLAILPWPQALLGETRLRAGKTDDGATMLEQSFARACQLGDPCWEGMAARGLAIAADLNGDPSRAFDGLADARRRCRRLADPYVWLDAYILDAQCELGRRHDHPDVTTWTDTLRELASRTGMKEMIVRSHLHGAALGRAADAEAATLLAADIDNPTLTSAGLHKTIP
jgi:DNA-binding SARP family transcriptional activator